MFVPKKRIPKLAAATLALAGCADDGYGLGEYGARVDRLDPPVTEFCMKALNCASRLYQGDIDLCRTLFLFYATPPLPADADACEEAWLDFFDCYTDAACVDFPVGNGDACADSIDALFLPCEIQAPPSGDEP